MTKYDQVGRVATVVAPVAEGRTAVIYHQTAVVTWDNARIVLDSGGWKSNTTKVRMNQAATVYNLGFWVYAERGKWFVRWGDRVLPFEDKMILDR